jgi:Nitroreductase family
MHDMSHQIVSQPAASAVDEAIASRKSVRAFLPTPVDRTTVEELLQLASRSASGSNIQPWRVRMALGHIDPEAPVNALTTERAPLADFATFDGW